MIEHIKPLTSLRGIAAMFILFHHFFCCLMPTDINKIVQSYSMFFSNGYLWVDFFFILSGFILTHVYASNFSAGINIHSYRSFVISRLARIYPLHIFMLLPFVGLELLKTIYILYLRSSGSNFLAASPEPFTGTYSLSNLLSNVFLLQAIDMDSPPPLFDRQTTWNEPSWSISAEWIVYLIFPILVFLLSKTRRFLNLAIYLIALFGLLPLIKVYGSLDFLGTLSLVRCMLEGIIGIITYKIYKNGIYKKFFSLNQTTMVTLMIIFMIMNYNFNDILIIPFFSLLILSASIGNNVMAKFLVLKFMFYLGQISYSIYMVHWFILKITQQFSQKLFNTDFGIDFNLYQTLIALCIFILAVILIASLTYKLIEVPMRKNLKNLAVAKGYL